MQKIKLFCSYNIFYFSFWNELTLKSEVIHLIFFFFIKVIHPILNTSVHDSTVSDAL